MQNRLHFQMRFSFAGRMFADMASPSLPLRFRSDQVQPLLDAVSNASFRVSAWRRALVEAARPRRGDVIIQLGADAAIAAMLVSACPNIVLSVLDDDEGALNAARRRLADARVHFHVGTLGAPPQVSADLAATKIVAARPFAAGTDAQLAMRVAWVRANLRTHGAFHVMEPNFPNALTLVQHAQRAPHIEAVMRALRAGGFVGVDEAERFMSLRGPLSLVSARLA